MAVTEVTALRLSPVQKNFLLRSGRSSMEAAVRKQTPPSPDTSDPILLQPCGAFVTLTISGELRGCIGFFEPIYPIVEAVWRSAVKAALDDHRFAPVRPAELHRIGIEISLLSPKVSVEATSDIVIGRDGLYLETGSAKWLLLPQVATEYGWDADTFLLHLFRKCEILPVPIGTPGVAVYRFSAEIFSDPPESPRTPPLTQSGKPR